MKIFISNTNDRKKKQKFVRSLCKEEINWQDQNEKKWLEELLTNDRTIHLLSDYLILTKVGEKEGRKKKELK